MPGHPARPATPAAARRSLLRPLGIVGYDAVEPALLAALATEEPLLLVSDHGAAKTLLLLRLAEALGLELRHYNASLLQFDDLAGFPIPCERTGAICYASPPGANWGAEAVFFDEIGRCRPDVANRSSTRVASRGSRSNGCATAGRPPTRPWRRSARTAPMTQYDGVERLDPALADRFAYVVGLPCFGDLPDDDRAAVIRGIGERPAPEAARAVRELVQATRDLLAIPNADLGEAVVTYITALAPALGKSGIVIGGRRAATLARNVRAVRAASLALGRRTGDAAFAAALFVSIPDIVRRRSRARCS